MTKLITNEQRAQLLANGWRSQADSAFDPAPVVKLFTPDANATWLITDVAPYDHDLAFCLADLGQVVPQRLGDPFGRHIGISPQLKHVQRRAAKGFDCYVSHGNALRPDRRSAAK